MRATLLAHFSLAVKVSLAEKIYVQTNELTLLVSTLRFQLVAVVPRSARSALPLAVSLTFPCFIVRFCLIVRKMFTSQFFLPLHSTCRSFYSRTVLIPNLSSVAITYSILKRGIRISPTDPVLRWPYFFPDIRSPGFFPFQPSRTLPPRWVECLFIDDAGIEFDDGGGYDFHSEHS